MTKQKHTTTRRHIIAAAAAFAPAGALAAIPGASGANDEKLRRLFEEWERAADAYSVAADREDKADTAYIRGRRVVSQRVHDAMQAIALNKIAEDVFKKQAGEAGGLKFEPGHFDEKRRLERLHNQLAEFLEGDETPESFAQYCVDENDAVMRHNDELHRQLGLDDAQAAMCAASDIEDEAARAVANTPADTLAGVAIKLRIYERMEHDFILHAIAADARRLSGLPPQHRSETA